MHGGSTPARSTQTQWEAGSLSAGSVESCDVRVLDTGGAGRTTGLGDIHPLLYQHPSALRDITAGSNGHAAGGGEIAPIAEYSSAVAA